jgi:hypothetical protein
VGLKLAYTVLYCPWMQEPCSDQKVGQKGDRVQCSSWQVSCRAFVFVAYFSSLLQLEWGYCWWVWFALSNLSASWTSWPKTSLLLENVTETSWHRFTWNCGQIILCLSTPTVSSWGCQWLVMAAGHCYLWWRWWFDTFWATLIRLWLHSLSVSCE